MNMNNCDKYALLATLESQMAILIHAKEEYGRLQESLESKHNKMATKMLAVIGQNYARLMVLLDKVIEIYQRVNSLGGKYCIIDFDNQEQMVCGVGVGGMKYIECDHPVSDRAMLDTNESLPPNLWTVEYNWLLSQIKCMDVESM